MPGTGPRPFKSAPWHTAQRVVLPLLPVVTSASPFLMLPTGTYAMNPDRGSRSVSVRSVSSGTSMIRSPIGSVSFPSSFRNIPPAMRVFGTAAASTTLIHGVHFIAAK